MDYRVRISPAPQTLGHDVVASIRNFGFLWFSSSLDDPTINGPVAQWIRATVFIQFTVT